MGGSSLAGSAADVLIPLPAWGSRSRRPATASARRLSRASSTFSLHDLLALALVALLLFGRMLARLASAADPDGRTSLDRIDASRLILSHGRTDRVREDGIATGLLGFDAPVDPGPTTDHRNIPGITATAAFEAPAAVLAVRFASVWRLLCYHSHTGDIIRV